MRKLTYGNILERLKEIHREYLIPGLIFLITTIIALEQSSLAPFAGGKMDFDGGVYLYTGWKMAAGYLPYLDSWDNKGLLLYIINMIGIIINYNHGLWLIEILSLFVSAVFMYKTFRFWASKSISIISVIYVLITIAGLLNGGNYTEEFALPFSYIAIYIFAKYIFKDFDFKNYQSVLIGATFAATMLLRPNIATVWPAFCIVYFSYMLYKKKFSNALRFCIFFILGVVLTIIPFAYYLLHNNILNEFLNSVFTIPMGFNKPSIQQRLFAVRNLLVILNIPGEILIVAIGCWIGSTYIFLKKGFASDGSKLIYFSTLAAFFVNIYANSLSGYSYVHYAISFIPILSLPAMFAVKWSINRLKIRNSKKPNWFTISFVSSLMILLVLPSLIIQFYTDKAAYCSQDPLKNYIVSHTTDNDKIQVYSDCTELYYKTKRQAASRFSYTLTNGVLDDKFEKLMTETVFNDCIEQKPMAIVISTKYEDYITKLKLPINNKQAFENFLRKSYKLDAVIDEHKIYLRKD